MEVEHAKGADCAVIGGVRIEVDLKNQCLSEYKTVLGPCPLFGVDTPSTSFYIRLNVFTAFLISSMLSSDSSLVVPKSM